jgi:hypothetical protein
MIEICTILITYLQHLSFKTVQHDGVSSKTNKIILINRKSNPSLFLVI